MKQIKTALKQAFANVKGAVTATHTELNHTVGLTSAAQTQINTKGAIAGQTWTGTHNYTGATITVPTQSGSDNSSNAASTAQVQAAIASVNTQTTLSASIATGTSVTLSPGQHVICTNTSAVTVTLTGTWSFASAGRVTFTNSSYANVIDPGSMKIFGVSGTRTVNAKNSSPTFTYVDASTGVIY